MATVCEASAVLFAVEYWSWYCRLAAAVKLSVAAVHWTVKDVVVGPLTVGVFPVGAVVSTV